MANPRKFSEKIALHNQKQAEETAAFEKIMREVSDATNKVNTSSRRARVKAPKPVVNNDSMLRPSPVGLGSFRSGSLPNVAAPQASAEPENTKPEEVTLAAQYGMAGGRSGGASPSRSPVQRGRASSSVGPMRRPADRKHDTSPYGSTVYLSPPPDSNWRRTNSDSALHQSCGGEQPAASQPLSPHHPLHSHAHPHSPHQNHRRAADIHLDVLGALGMNPSNRPRSSCEIPRIPNNNNVYESGDGGGGGGGGGGLACGELQVPGGSLPDLTSVHFPPPHYLPHPHRTDPDYQTRYSPTSPGAVSPNAGSGSPATGGLSPASGSPVGATVPLSNTMHHPHEHSQLYDTQNHLSVPNTNNYLHHNKNMSPLDHSWISSSCYQTQCSPPSQYSSTSNINIPSPTMVHSPGSPAESPQTDYNNLHQALLQPFEQITMLDSPVSSYNTTYMNHSSPQTTNSQHTYPQSPGNCGTNGTGAAAGVPRRGARDPVPGGGYALPPLASPAPATPPSIPDIILTDYSGELDPGIFGGEEAQLRAGLDLDDLTLLEEPSALLPDSAVEHELLDRL
ncbi:CREB-regulated transcription coactivator isoform X2 [Choristoneura fumiferana]|uniref:CREB-regulated transcription coactivator isoform X2 n=1 Tax=Choristoneura fumiferana TaxID=7141 RepID=UPI003D158988